MESTTMHAFSAAITEKYWQNGLSVLERQAYLLESGHGANVQFLVGRDGQKKELIKAHKFVLKMGSSVFEGQFNFDKTAGKPKDELIKVEDVIAYAFKAMLEFLYLDNTQMLDAANAIDIYFCAKKYMIDVLMEKCRQFIGKFAYFTLDTERMLALSQPEIEEILGSDLLEADEIFLFNCLNIWANKQSQIRIGNMLPAAEMKRQMIGLAIYEIRFPLITLADFTNKIVPAGLLSDKDTVRLYVHFTGDHKGPLSFLGNERKFANHLVKEYYCAQCRKNSNNNPCSRCGYPLMYCGNCKNWRNSNYHYNYNSVTCCGRTLTMESAKLCPMGIDEARKKVMELQQNELAAVSQKRPENAKQLP